MMVVLVWVWSVMVVMVYGGRSGLGVVSDGRSGMITLGEAAQRQYN